MFNFIIFMRRNRHWFFQETVLQCSKKRIVFVVVLRYLMKFEHWSTTDTFSCAALNIFLFCLTGMIYWGYLWIITHLIWCPCLMRRKLTFISKVEVVFFILIFGCYRNSLQTEKVIEIRFFEHCKLHRDFTQKIFGSKYPVEYLYAFFSH